MSNHMSGRHRDPIRLNRASSLSAAIARSARPAAKASAVFAVSGGMVASLVLPASAATHTTAKPKVPGTSVLLPTAAHSAALAPFVSPSFGDIGFLGVTKPKPVAAPHARLRADHRVQVNDSISTATRSVPASSTGRSSRSATRQSVTGPGPGQAARSKDVIGLAVSLSGIPYLYGGTTPSGFDCSGFTQYIFGKLGVSLPRTAEQQRQATTPVSTPEVGDLVFFGNPAWHNGIYAGNGMMYDAPKTGLKTGLRAIWNPDVTFGRVVP